MRKFWRYPHWKQDINVFIPSKVHQYFGSCFFSPDTAAVKAAPKLCAWEKCALVLSWSCESFSTDDVMFDELNEVSFQLQMNEIESAVNTISDDDDAIDFLVPTTICAVDASHSSSDTVWFIKITKNGSAKKNQLIIITIWLDLVNCTWKVTTSNLILKMQNAKHLAL